MTSTADTEHEVIVLGGRCAGAATAMLLACEGHDVTCQLSLSPDVDEFVATQHRLSDHLEAEGIALAGPSDVPQPHSTKDRCMSGTHSQTTIHDYFGVGAERAHEAATVHDVDHPKVLVGGDNGPTPVEYVLHALAGCLTAGLVNIAAARGIAVDEVTSTVAGDIDLNGIIGLDDSVRNGCDDIRVTFTISSDAPADKLRDLVEQSRARSAVFDIITNSVPVSIEVDTGVPPEER
jgi:uncharacterized OsmC-like protein